MSAYLVAYMFYDFAEGIMETSNWFMLIALAFRASAVIYDAVKKCREGIEPWLSWELTMGEVKVIRLQNELYHGCMANGTNPVDVVPTLLPY